MKYGMMTVLLAACALTLGAQEAFIRDLSGTVELKRPGAAASAPTTGGNYRLKAGSPAINTGSADYYDSDKTPDLTTVTTDLDGRPRFNGTIDMGAYEYRP
ncbi:MAG: hypothetical protein LBQ57_12650 [Spirochaetales bacterium]|jgi:hypothetical protein|nr:hypothetical protein [Spirochaetales bacterium]